MAAATAVIGLLSQIHQCASPAPPAPRVAVHGYVTRNGYRTYQALRVDVVDASGVQSIVSSAMGGWQANVLSGKLVAATVNPAPTGCYSETASGNASPYLGDLVVHLICRT